MSRKREAVHQEVKDQTAGYLQGAAHKIQRRKFSEGLGALDQVVSQVEKAEHRCRIASLSADSQFLQGKFSIASEIYGQAVMLALEEGAEDLRSWVRPLVGQVLSLLKEVRVEEAAAIARQGWDRVVDQYEKHQQWLKQQVNEQLAQGGKVQVGKRPVRPSVLGARLGQLFFQEGEISYAKEFFQKAIGFNPQGGCRARIGLAKVALRESNTVDGLMRANEALRLGKFSAKTVSAWKVLIEANQRLNRKGVENDLLEGLNQVKESRVRARAILELVQALRGYGDENWKELGQQWLQKEGKKHPIVAAEVKKLFFAEARLKKDVPKETAEAARRLLHTRKLSAVEYLAAMKEWVRSQLLGGHEVRLESLVEEGMSKYGEKFGAKLRHGLARSCMMARQYDRARTLLGKNVTEVKPTDSQWARSVWSLARLEEFLKDHVRAAELYEKFFIEPSIPLRFRLQARVGWAKCLMAAGNPEPIVAAKDEIWNVLQELKDWNVLLDFGRQLRLAPDALKQLRQQVCERAEALAFEDLKQSQNPTTALRILHRLTRRQLMDLARLEQVRSLYWSWAAGKLNWLWTEQVEFWEYVGWVFEALNRTRESAAAQVLMNQYLSDPATPLEGRVRLILTLADWETKHRDAVEGMKRWRQAVQLLPRYQGCGEAYYWLALAAWKAGDVQEATRLAGEIHVTLGNHRPFLSHWQQDACAYLIEAGMKVDGLAQQLGMTYTEEFLQRCFDKIQRNLELVP